ncbi:putative ribitol transporter [Escherichia coli]|uniref:Putative ribitol transporter n=1 Tax=Escherichia coli TaxID=562 RepID=A0A2X1MUE2_ECOLX|nr:putative ribitol transporter [Escherichia coli]
MRVIRWFGCLGMAASSLAFYYMPQYFWSQLLDAMIPAIALGTFVAAFVPMAAVFPALEPKHKGAAISVYNLSAGMSNFLAPALPCVITVLALSVWSLPIQHCIYWPLSFAHSFALSSQDSVLRQ